MKNEPNKIDAALVEAQEPPTQWSEPVVRRHGATAHVVYDSRAAAEAQEPTHEQANSKTVRDLPEATAASDPTAERRDDGFGATDQPSERRASDEGVSRLAGQRPGPPDLHRLVDDLLSSARSGLLFGNFDEPLDDASRRIVRIIHARVAEVAAGAEARPPDPPQPSLVQVYLSRELCAYLDTLTITSENIGAIRRACFVPWNSEWNGIVRDETAKREQSDRADARPEERRWEDLTADEQAAEAAERAAESSRSRATPTGER